MDCDGLVSATDIFLANDLIAARHDIYMRVLFHIYVVAAPAPASLTDMLWAGNKPKAADSSGGVQTNSKASSAASLLTGSWTPGGDGDGDGRVITRKHVAAVFENFGYHGEDGGAVFDILCQSLAKIDEVSKHRSGFASSLHFVRSSTGLFVLLFCLFVCLFFFFVCLFVFLFGCWNSGCSR